MPFSIVHFFYSTTAVKGTFKSTLEIKPRNLILNGVHSITETEDLWPSNQVRTHANKGSEEPYQHEHGKLEF